MAFITHLLTDPIAFKRFLEYQPDCMYSCGDAENEPSVVEDIRRVIELI